MTLIVSRAVVYDRELRPELIGDDPQLLAFGLRAVCGNGFDQRQRHLSLGLAG